MSKEIENLLYKIVEAYEENKGIELSLKEVTILLNDMLGCNISAFKLRKRYYKKEKT